VTWEAKGDAKEAKWPRRQSLEKAVCGFANSELGGVLLIGVNRTDAGWRLDGLQPPANEIPIAVGQTIRTGVRPIPRFDLVHFDIGDRRSAAVVEVEPVNEPPCITRDGRIFVRTSGQTVPVVDPGDLARLFGTGDHAREAAESSAATAGTEAINRGAVGPYGSDSEVWKPAETNSRVSLGLAATGYLPDIGGRLFGGRFAELISSEAGGALVPERVSGSSPDHGGSRRAS
jgi:Putative DNA-binding domain